MAVAAAREAQARAAGAGPAARVGAAFGHQREGFERVRHLGVGEAVVAVAAACVAGHEAGVEQPGEVAARGGGTHGRGLREVAGARRFAAEQETEHARAARVGHQRRDARDAGLLGRGRLQISTALESAGACARSWNP